MNPIIIIGAGLAGLSAALTIAESGRKCILVSKTPSERAQSNLAAGGMNAAMGDPISFQNDTLISGEDLSDAEAVNRLVNASDEVLQWLREQGVPFQLDNEKPMLRKLGGHQKKRTVFAGSITGKAIMAALIDNARKFIRDAEILMHASITVPHSFRSLG